MQNKINSKTAEKRCMIISVNPKYPRRAEKPVNAGCVFADL